MLTRIDTGNSTDFYPRSPCGERHRLATVHTWRKVISIHALLAESDDNKGKLQADTTDFYPRSPCGERLSIIELIKCGLVFLSTLSLRRATDDILAGVNELLISIHALLAESDLVVTAFPGSVDNFYPRSPCGERRSGHR